MIKVLQAGVQTTLQDLGRYGYQSYGISVSGAMCTLSCKLANILVGNAVNTPVLEIVQSPHRFLFEKDCWVSFCGGGIIPQVDNKALDFNTPIFITKSTILELKKPTDGFRLYMAVGGGFKVPRFLGSASTHLVSQLGGLDGKAIAKNHILETNYTKNIPKKNLNLTIKSYLPYSSFSKKIRILKGAEFDLLTNASKDNFEKNNFVLTNEYSRMGYRLQSNSLQLINHKEMISTAVTKGTIQLLPSGQLIVLMSDCQTVGGYPRIAQIVDADFYHVAQLKPNDDITFEIIELEEAEKLYLENEERMLSLEKIINA